MLTANDQRSGDQNKEQGPLGLATCFFLRYKTETETEAEWVKLGNVRYVGITRRPLGEKNEGLE